ncbi:hypothetical protein SanaruYs_34080 [Chryseotalea sanaruensis]|uniref:DUF4623 domain-containing protein n=1 Tax=Chryseotalea sanaruensis TaxID=2482724 RepID=A0A401UE33_9BACT|nr:hypothetical protein [Chryseotalea sanaruensis]GCC53165.1 hypothetical protein SanaruYs_34080 [Chryseotalea sanaruensis]
MNKLLKISFILFAVINLSNCETEKSVGPDFKDYFVKYYGDAGNQQGVDMVVNDDATIFLLGNTDRNNEQRFFVTKIDTTGKILLKKTFGQGGSIVESAIDIEPTVDGNYIIAIQRIATPGGDRDTKLLLISEDLIGLDSIIFDNNVIANSQGDEAVSSVTPYQINGEIGFLVTGSTTLVSTTGDLTDPFTYKVNQSLSLDPFWVNNPGNNGTLDQGVKIVPRQAGFLLFLNTNPESNASRTGFHLQPIESDGDATTEGSVGFARISESGDQEFLQQVVSNPDNGDYLLVGNRVNDGGTQVYFVAMTNSLGFVPAQHRNAGNQTVALNNLEGSISGVSVAPSKQTGYLLVANQELNLGNIMTTNIVLARLRFSGEVVWTTQFGVDDSYKAAKIEELPNGKILIVGTGTLGNQEKMMLLKVNSDGQFLK